MMSPGSGWENLWKMPTSRKPRRPWRQCITVKPTYSAAYYALAQSLLKLNRVEECRQVSDQGIDVSTKNGDAMVTKNLELLKSSLPAA